jgi:uncharacterized protein (TIGR02677 family)
MSEDRLQLSKHYGVFAHLQAEKYRLYRAILSVFRAERERFMIALRPADVRRAPSVGGMVEPTAGIDEITAALDQLVAWGNLTANRDTADVATVEDFYRQRLIYQFSASGEAAEHALLAFERHLGKPGELQATALHDIVRLLRSIDALLADDPFDAVKLHEALRSLTDRLEELTTRAQSFLRALHAPTELHGFALERFLEYKDSLIDYLQRFVGELIVCANQIATQLREIDAPRMAAALEAVADHALADAFAPTAADRAATVESWRSRWAGVHRWFSAEAGEISQAELLRARARSAIPALLTTIANLNDRRSRRTDRAADFQSLAVWFASAPSDRDLHRLWRASFGLVSARHLRTNDETLDAAETRGDTHRTSWQTAAPMVITPRLRRTGRHDRRGAAAAVIDRAAEKAFLRRLAEQEAAQVEQARAALANGRSLRLAELSGMDAVAFPLFLDLLGDALASKTSPGAPVETTSTDGALHIRLEPVAGAPFATLVTLHGDFSGPDHIITITRTGDERPPVHPRSEGPPA